MEVQIHALMYQCQYFKYFFFGAIIVWIQILMIVFLTHNGFYAVGVVAVTEKFNKLPISLCIVFMSRRCFFWITV